MPLLVAVVVAIAFGKYQCMYCFDFRPYSCNWSMLAEQIEFSFRKFFHVRQKCMRFPRNIFLQGFHWQAKCTECMRSTQHACNAKRKWVDKLKSCCQKILWKSFVLSAKYEVKFCRQGIRVWLEVGKGVSKTQKKRYRHSTLTLFWCSRVRVRRQFGCSCV